jgi:hypothetical protein
MLTISTGRLPTRSLSLPHSGAANSCIREKTASSAVTCSGEAAKRTA